MNNECGNLPRLTQGIQAIALTVGYRSASRYRSAEKLKSSGIILGCTWLVCVDIAAGILPETCPTRTKELQGTSTILEDQSQPLLQARVLSKLKLRPDSSSLLNWYSCKVTGLE